MIDDYDDTYGEGPQEPRREVEPEQDWSPIRVQTFATLSDVRRHVEGLLP